MQSTTLMKTQVKGFTLIELLVVIAIIGLLSTIVAAPIQSARKKAKDTKKLAEVRQLQTSLANYANDNGSYPAGVTGGAAGNSPTLSVLSPQYIPSIPNGFTSSSTRDKYMYVSYHGIAPGGNATTTFGYHLGSTLEVYNSVLDSDDDCWGVVSTTTPNTTGNKNGGGCGVFVSGDRLSLLNASYFGTSTSAFVSVGGSYTNAAYAIGLTPLTLAQAASSTVAITTYNYLAHPFWPSAGADFQGRGANEAATSSCATVDQCLYDTTDIY